MIRTFIPKVIPTVIGHTPRLATRTLASFLLGLCITLLVSAPAHAGVFSQFSELVSNNIDLANDESIKMLSGILGEDFVHKPSQQGVAGAQSGNTILGIAFGHFNWFVFLVGMAWMAYVAGASLLQTMHEGKVLGRRFSQVWLPVRIGLGALSLLPVFQGFCFAQVLMMVCALTGIAGANLVSRSAIDAAAGFSTLVKPSISTKQTLNTANPVEQYLLEGALCMKVAAKKAAEQHAYDVDNTAAKHFEPFQYTIAQEDQNTAKTLTVSFAGQAGEYSCGKLILTTQARSKLNFMGQQINGINYTAIAQTGLNAHRQAINQVVSNAILIAQGAGDSDHGAPYQQAMNLMDTGYFGSYPKKVQLAYQAAPSELDAQAKNAISNQITSHMKRSGWVSLGAYYGVLAEANEAINQMLDPTIQWKPPSEPDTDATTQQVINTLNASADQSNDQSNDQNTTQGAEPVLKLGDALMLGVIDQGTQGGQTAGNFNPILAYKTLGDNIIAMSEQFIAAGQNAKTVDMNQVITKEIAKNKIYQSVSQLAEKNSPLIQFFNNIKHFVSQIGWLFFMAGAVMAYYLPLIPFILWFAALTRWIVSVFESLVGASMWALAHFDADGEGMGQRAGYGYIYALGNFAYPILMVIAFLVASGLVTVLGTFLFKIFGSAMASAQGATLTSVTSLGAHVLIFMVLGITLITSVFNMCLYFQEKVLAFMGAQGQNAMAGDYESKTNSMFMNAGGHSTQAGRIMSGVAGQNMPGKPPLLGSTPNRSGLGS